MRAVGRTIDRTGQRLLIPAIEIEGWWTTLDLPMKDVIRLYEDHGTSEQFHSEIKTDLDTERLPSGKFATNALILTLAGPSYNIRRFVGQIGLRRWIDPGTPSGKAVSNQNSDSGTHVFGCSHGEHGPPPETGLQPPLSCL